MIGYAFVVLAVLAGSTKGGVSKKLSGSIRGAGDNLFINGLRMVLCACIAFAAAVLSGGIGSLRAEPGLILLSLLSAVSFAGFTYTWMLCAKSGALVMIDVFLTAGVLLPMLGGWIFWGDRVSPRQWIGFAVLLVGVGFLCAFHNSIKPKMTRKLFALLVACGALNGVQSFSQKFFAVRFAGVGSASFQFYTYLFAALLFIGILCLKKFPPAEGFRDKKRLGGIAIISVLLYLNLFFKLLAGKTLTAAQIYPLCQGLGILNSSLIAAFFFGEKINGKAVAGMLVSFGGLLLINL